jgi:Tfp pilus assembly PilM family ATPase
LTLNDGETGGFNTAYAPIDKDEYDRDQAIARAIRTCLGTGKFTGRKASLVICGEDTLIQHQRVTMDGDEVDEAELKRKVHKELCLNNACDIDNSYTRYLQAGKIFERNEHKEELILVVVGRLVIERYLKICEGLKLEVQSINAEPYALQRAIVGFGPPEWMEGAATAVLNVGESKAELLIIRNSELTFVRTLPLGIDKFMQSVASKMNFGPEEVEKITAAMDAGRMVDETVIEAIKPAVRLEMETLCSEVLTCFRYFSFTYNRESVDKLVVVGNAPTQLVDKKFLEDRLGVTVHFWSVDKPKNVANWKGSLAQLPDEYVALAGVGVDEKEKVKTPIDFLPPEVTERREQIKTNKIRIACAAGAIVLMGLFYWKSEQRLWALNSLNKVCQDRSNQVEANKNEVSLIQTKSQIYITREEDLSTTVCPILPTRVLAEIVRVAGSGISLVDVQGDFIHGTQRITSGRRKQQPSVLPSDSPLFLLNIEGKAASSEDVTLFVERLKETGAFSSIREEGFWDDQSPDSNQKKFTIKVTVGEGK